MVQTTKRAVNRAWDVAGFRAAMAANTELDVLIETANLPARDEFRRDHPGRGSEGSDRLARRAVPGRAGVSRSRSRRLRYDLTPLLAPRSIAIVGASESPDSWAPEIERSLRHVGYEGELFPINPKYDEVWGRRCLHAIAELPRGVDLVVFVVPAQRGRSHDRRLRRPRRAEHHGGLVGVRRGGRGGRRSAGGAPRGGAAHPHPGARAQRRGFRELRRPRRALRHHPAAGAASRARSA